MNSIPSTVFAGASAAAQAAAASGSTTSTSTASSADSVKFSSSDFMTLLVAEMKNQDPTSPTDPTQYVSQLVNVNSLQQLIEINKAVSGQTNTSSATATSGV